MSGLVSSSTTIRTESFVQALSEQDGSRATVVRELLQFFVWTGCTRIQAMLSKGRLEFRFNAAPGKALLLTDYGHGLPFVRLFGTSSTLYVAQGNFAVSMTAAGVVCTAEIGFQIGPDAHAVLPVAAPGDEAAVQVVNQELERVLRIELARGFVLTNALEHVSLMVDGRVSFEMQSAESSSTGGLGDVYVSESRLNISTSNGADTCVLRTYRQGKFAVAWLPGVLVSAVGEPFGGLCGPSLTCIQLDTTLLLKAPLMRTPVEVAPSFTHGRHAAHNRAQIDSLRGLLTIAAAAETEAGRLEACSSESLLTQLTWHPAIVSDLFASRSGGSHDSSPVTPEAAVEAKPAVEPTVTLQSLGLPGRSLGGFRQVGLHTLAQVADFSDDLLLAIPGVGPRAVEIIRQALRREATPSQPRVTVAIAQDIASDGDSPEIAQTRSNGEVKTPSFHDSIAAWLDVLPDSERQIIEKYYGLRDGNRSSMRAIADESKRPVYVIEALETRARERLSAEAPQAVEHALTITLARYRAVAPLDVVSRDLVASYAIGPMSPEGLVELIAGAHPLFGAGRMRGVMLVYTPKSLETNLKKAAMKIGPNERAEGFVLALRERAGIDLVLPKPGLPELKYAQQDVVVPMSASSLTYATPSVDSTPRTMSFQEAKAAVQALRFVSREAFATWAEGAERPAGLPDRPDEWYSEEEWTSWDDWLGLSASEPAYAPFETARAHARSLRFSSLAAWDAFVQVATDDGLGPMPRDPAKAYANDGWRGWADWLGLGSGGEAPGPVAAAFERLRPQLGTMDRDAGRAELTRLGVWRYPLVGTVESAGILSDLLSLPYAGKLKDACFELADRIDRALLANPDANDDWE